MQEPVAGIILNIFMMIRFGGATKSFSQQLLTDFDKFLDKCYIGNQWAAEFTFAASQIRTDVSNEDVAS
jgi:hypothetical protein